MLHKLRPKSEFSRNVLTLMTGTTIAQSISIMTLPVLSRLYTPEDFGVFSIYIALCTIISTVATGRYELSILLPKSDKDAAKLLVISSVFSLFVSLFAFLIFLIFGDVIVLLFDEPKLTNFFYILPVVVLFTGISQAFLYWKNRLNDFKSIALSRVIQSFSLVSVNIGFGLLGVGSIGLVMGNLTAQMVIFIVLFITSFQYFKVNFDKKYYIKYFLLLKKYIDYPLKSTIGAFFNSISYQAEILLMAIFFPSHIVGIFYLINRLINMPKQFISGSIWQAFLSNTHKPKNVIFYEIYSKQKSLLLLTTFPFFTISLVAPELLVLFLGEQWSEGIVFITPLMIATHISFIVSSFSLFLILNKPEDEMKFNVLFSLLKVFVIVASYYMFDDIYITVVSFSIVQFVMFYLLGSWNYKKLNKSYLFFTKLYLPYFFMGIFILLIFHEINEHLSLLMSIIILLTLNTLYFLSCKYAK